MKAAGDVHYVTGDADAPRQPQGPSADGAQMLICYNMLGPGVSEVTKSYLCYGFCEVKSLDN